MGELAQPLVAAREATAPKLRRDVGFLGLGFAELGSIIGAGWLFAALYASSLAGPAALISWVLGGEAMMLLALTHAEQHHRSAAEDPRDECGGAGERGGV